MERDTASLVTGKKGWEGKEEGGGRDGNGRKKRIGAEMRMLWTDRWTDIYIYVCVCTCMYMYVYVCVCTCMCMYMYMYVHVCVYIYI